MRFSLTNGSKTLCLQGNFVPWGYARTFRLLSLWLLTLPLFLCACEEEHKAKIPIAKQGILDLSHYDFVEGNRPVSLDGEWEFFWQEFLYPGSNIDTPIDPTYIGVPGPWNAFEVDGEEIGASGFGTFRLKVLLSEATTNRDLVLRIPNQPTAYRLYVNDELLAEVGSPGKDDESAIPDFAITYVEISPEVPVLDLVFHVSNYHHRVGGLRFKIQMGLDSQMLQAQRVKWFFDLSLVGALMIMGLYHLNIFLMRRRDFPALYFSLFCICYCVNVFLTGEYYYRYVFSSLDWTTQMRVEYISLFLFFQLFLGFVSHLFTPRYGKYVRIAAIVIAQIFCFIVLISHSLVFSGVLKYFQINLLLWFAWVVFVLIWAAALRTPGALSSLLGILVLFGAGIHDILHLNHIISIAPYTIAPFGVLIFLIAQSSVLGQLLLKTYKTASRMSETLEEMVNDRTKELADAFERIQRAHSGIVKTEKMAALGQLIAGIAHEMNTPLGIIRASASNLLEAFNAAVDPLSKIPDRLNSEERGLLFGFVESTFDSDEDYVSAIALRRRRKVLSQFLKDEAIEHSDYIAETLCTMRSEDSVKEIMPLLKKEKSKEIVDLAYNLSRQYHNTVTIEHAVERATKMVFALKSYSYTDRSGERVLASIKEGIDTIITLYHGGSKRGVNLVVDELDDLPMISCYPDELNQVWTNIIHNALTAINYKGEVEIRGGQNEDWVWVDVSNNGPRIPDDVIELIFDSFYTTKSKGEGSGLGLSVSKRIIDKHQGDIQVSSSEERTTFRVMLPRRVDSKEGEVESASIG